MEFTFRYPVYVNVFGIGDAPPPPDEPEEDNDEEEGDDNRS